MGPVEVVAVLIVLAIAIAISNAAANKGRSQWAYFFGALICWPIALILVLLERPHPDLEAPVATGVGWHDDPSGQHTHRYHDGARWTDDVADQGIPSKDPLRIPPPPTAQEPTRRGGRRGAGVFKIALGVMLGLTLTITGCAILISSGDTGTSSGSKDQGDPSANVPTSTGAKPGNKVFAKASASGDYADTNAAGTDGNPSTVRVRVDSTPAQSALVSWTMTCTKGLSAGSKDGQFTATTPIDRELTKPTDNPDSCIVSAGAQLEQGGKETVRLIEGPAPAAVAPDAGVDQPQTSTPVAHYRSCGAGVRAGHVTTCDFARRVAAAYGVAVADDPSGPQTVQALSLATGRTYTLTCARNAGNVRCHGGDRDTARVKFRWQ